MTQSTQHRQNAIMPGSWMHHDLDGEVLIISPCDDSDLNPGCVHIKAENAVCITPEAMAVLTATLENARERSHEEASGR